MTKARPDRTADTTAGDASAPLPGTTPKGTAYGNTTDVVTDRLREDILSGALPPNTWIREHEIAQRFAVSRTPVREAMRRLSDEGLMQRSANQGTIVSSMSLEDILAVYAVRETLEGLAARIAATRRPIGLVDALMKIHREMEAAEGDGAKLADLNLKFHGVIRQASNNSYLERFLTQVEYAARRFGLSTYDVPGRSEEALHEHYAVILAIAAGDAETAETLAIAHMRHAREVRMKQIFKRGFA